MRRTKQAALALLMLGGIGASLACPGRGPLPPPPPVPGPPLMAVRSAPADPLPAVIVRPDPGAR